MLVSFEMFLFGFWTRFRKFSYTFFFSRYMHIAVNFHVKLMGKDPRAF